VAVQTDGEAAGTTPVQIEVVPAALTVVVPRDGPTGLFLKP
jgi:diacylglycerol kinase family enzyme